MDDHKAGGGTAAGARSSMLSPAAVNELVDIATRFYVLGQSQREIARSLGCDPSTISRDLRLIRDLGIVRFEIRRPHEHVDDAGAALAAHFHLHRALVLRNGADVPHAAADYLGSLLTNGMRVGISWGRAVSAVVSLLPMGLVTNLDITALHGGISNTGDGTEGHEVLTKLGSLSAGSRVTYLHAPALVNSADVRQGLVSQESIKSVLRKARSTELALLGIGNVDETSPLLRYGNINESDKKRLRAAGAVGDICGWFFTAGGEPVHVISDRLIAIDWADLARIPRVVAVAAGPEKVHAIIGALRTGLIKTVVTDEATARSVMEMVSQ